MRRLRSSDLGDGGHDLRPDADTADRLVHGLLVAAAKDGISALSLQRALEIGSQQTAWAMLHRLRSVLVRPGRERLTGIVEVDETYVGGEEEGLRGGRAKGKKALVGVAVEVRERRGYGRCRMAILTDASGSSLRPFVTAHVEPGATVITDAWQGYAGIENLGYARDRRSQLELAVGHGPVRYHDIVAGKRPRKIPPAPPAAHGHPPSLERPPAQRPWRTAYLDYSG